MFHSEPGRIELVAVQSDDPETDWYVKQFGGGIMITDGVAGRTFIPADQLDEYDYLEFVSRSNTP